MDATIVRSGVNLIQAGLFRGPALLGALMGVSYIGEIAMRVLETAGSQIGINLPQAQEGSWRKTIRDTIRPYKDQSWKHVLLKGVALSIIGSLGFQFAALAFGPAPAIYNNVLAWLGPIRVDNAMHPAIQFAYNAVAGR